MTKWAAQVGWDETPHLSDDAKAGLLSSYSAHERDARTRGVPQLGAGAIYPIPESEIIIDPIELAPFWPRSYALDVGWNRTAGIWQAHDTENDIVYLYSEYYQGHLEPASHAQGIRARGAWMHGVIDPAARGRGQKDGEQLLRNYVDLGLQLSPALNGVESGIFEVSTRIASGRLKVFKTLTNWRAEYRTYRRDDKGHPVKENDHLMDATRYLIASGLSVESFDPKAYKSLASKPRHQIDYDPTAEYYAVIPKGRR